MNQADRIRIFVLDTCVRPARDRNLNELEVRAGDIHRAMNLTNAMPAVCSAVGSNKFEKFAGVSKIERSGPSNGSNACFRFRLCSEPSAVAERLVRPTALTGHRAEAPKPRPLPGSVTVTLVSCVKSKLPYKAPARELYTSTQFLGARRFAEATGGRWYVLSALYGLVEPDTVIAPYDYTLKSLPVVQRRAWAQKTFDQLQSIEPNLRSVTFLAGQRYREFLVPKLLERGVAVTIPMAHLRQGEQLAWLTRDHDTSD